ncbi:LLM class flavin-dependent oxidoreductase [Planobispora rosea]|uniref:LLM class flavin-dependent oxidoreductase n=1 Tax=Planobispora rosea TaxID=35762 RepID=UPI001670BC63|nr:LLM class flavin-dependent oxidoreductase [Planobispora rosea]
MLSFGVSFLPDATPTTMSAGDYFAGALEVCEFADRIGFGYVKMTEHYAHPYGGYCPSPLLFLSAVAARTRNIRLMTGGIMASFHHPVQIAAHTAMLDVMSGGRLDAGFARAWLPHEFDLFQVSMDESRARFVETVDAVVDLWTRPGAEAATPFFGYSGVDLLPGCVQRPHPPVWVAAVLSPQSFEWIARRGFGLLVTPGLRGFPALAEMVALYRSTFAEAHAGSGARPRVALSLPLIVADSDAEAVSASDEYLGRYLEVWKSAGEMWNSRTSADYAGYTGVSWMLDNDSPAKMRERTAAVVGGPDSAVEQITRIRQTVDPDVLLWQIDTGAQPASRALTTLRLFADKVQPALSLT